MPRPTVPGPPVPKPPAPKLTVPKLTVPKLTVLIGFADSLAAIESAWCLLDHGFEVCAFTRSGTVPALARSKRVRVVPVTAPEQLSSLIRDLRPAAVLPLDDHAVWVADRYAQRPVPGGPVIAGPTGKLATIALDKREQLLLAATAGFLVPESADAATEQPAGDGPWMVKPALAVELRDGRLHRPVGRMAVTPAQVRQIAAWIGGPAIAQPMLAGTGEGVFGIATAAGAAALSAHRRVRMMNPRGSGSSACRSVPLATDLGGPVREFISGCEWRGLFMVEMLRDTAGRPWFMELNGRTWGSMALARHRGLSYPSWAVQAALDPEFTLPYPGLAEVQAPHATWAARSSTWGWCWPVAARRGSRRSVTCSSRTAANAGTTGGPARPRCSPRTPGPRCAASFATGSPAGKDERDTSGGSGPRARGQGRGACSFGMVRRRIVAAEPDRDHLLPARLPRRADV